MLTRRHLITATAAALVTPALPRPVWAAATLDLGTVRIDTLLDGTLELPGDFILGGMPEDDLAGILVRHGLARDRLTPPCNVTLVRDGTNTILFDVGSGPDFQPSAGRLLEALDALGLTPEDITHVLFTHGHPDHLWGLLDEFDEPVFASAVHAMGVLEHAYWTDPATPDSIGEARVTFAIGAARRLEALADNIQLIEDGEEVLPGIVARLTPGHTPGHIAFDVHGDSGGAVIVGDALGNHHVAFERPDWTSGSDQDGPTAAATRRALLDRLAADGMTLVGFHLPEGGVGRAERFEGAYRFVPSA